MNPTMSPASPRFTRRLHALGRVVLALSGLLLALAAVPAQAARGVSADEVTARHTTEDGVEVVDFALPGATVRVFLPRDPVAGEIVSGRATAGWAARGERSRARAAKRLTDLTVEVGGRAWTPTPDESFSLRALEVCGALACVADGGGRAVAIRLLDRKGRPLAEALVPVRESAPPPPATYSAHPLGVTGETIRLSGPFDGDAATTRLALHGEETTVLVESRRGLVARVPLTAVGAGEQVLEEGADPRRYRFPFRGLAVSLGVNKPALQAGERTVVQLRVQGLEDLTAPLTVQLVSRRPQHAVLAAGPVESLEIHPTQVQGGGVYEWVGTAVGVSPGPLELVLSTHHAAEPVGPAPTSPEP